MGEDGKAGGQNINIAKDILGYSLNYFGGDYSPINTGFNPFPNSSGPLTAKSAYRPLYNGNISSMAVNIKPFNQPYLYNYRYDQLNRLTGMDTYAGLDTVNNNWNAISFTKSYNERVSYDGNGNIQKYNRYFDNQTVIMDSLTYNYMAGTNKLNYVKDSSSGTINAAIKIKDQSANNYEYDEIGNLIKDNSENIPSGGIKWNVYGKITEINHSQAGVLTNTKKINYYYDAAGNRIGKKLTKFGTANVSYTWYVRDAQGNVMHVYTTSVDTTDADVTDADKLAILSSANLQLSETHLYGSSRLGILNRKDNAEPTSTATSLYQYTRGQKFYEISNHLGNVLAVISDKKLGHSSNGSTLDYYNPDVVNVTDYYPFGMPMRGGSLGYGIPGGTQSGSTTVNGHTVPQDLTLTGNRTGAQPTEYVAANNVEFRDEFESASSDEFSAYIADASYAGTGNQANGGIGTNLAGGYRYGFNGKENDNEVKGEGNQIDYGMRIYDPRISKFLSVDPLQKKYPQLTPYQFASNSPIKYIDLDGLEAHRHWSDYDFNDLMNWFGDSDNSWTKIDRGEGPIGEKLKAFNYNFNLFGIAYFNGKALITGKDDYGQPTSRVDAAGNIIVTAIYHQALTKLSTQSAAVKLESKMGKVGKATEASTNEQASRANSGNTEAANASTTPQTQATPVQQWQAKAQGADHHIATNKNTISTARGGPWTPQFEPFFKKAGLDMYKGPENIVTVINHYGPHPEAYHQLVFKRLTEATFGIKPNTEAYKAAVTKTLESIAKDAQIIGTEVNRLLTSKK